MGFDELIRSIGEEAFRQRDEILARADEEAQGIVRAAEDRWDATLRQARERSESAARAEAARIVSRAQLAAQREVQAARYAVVAEAVRGAEERLGGLLGTAAYRDVLGRLLMECLAEEPGPVTVRCCREDRPAVEELALGLGREIAIEEAPFPLGGVDAAFGEEGRLVCRNGLEDRMVRLRPALLEEAGRFLFGPPAAEAAP